MRRPTERSTTLPRDATTAASASLQWSSTVIPVGVETLHAPQSLGLSSPQRHLPRHTQRQQSRLGPAHLFATPSWPRACHSATCPFGCHDGRPLPPFLPPSLSLSRTRRLVLAWDDPDSEEWAEPWPDPEMSDTATTAMRTGPALRPSLEAGASSGEGFALPTTSTSLSLLLSQPAVCAAAGSVARISSLSQHARRLSIGGHALAVSRSSVLCFLFIWRGLS